MRPEGLPVREVCPGCRKALARCYCHLVRPVRAGPKVVLLVHPREDRSRGAVNTSRMVRRCVEDAELLVGLDFRRHPRLEALLAEPGLAPFLLYPGEEALDPGDPEVGRLLAGRRPLLLALDGTWVQSRQMLRLAHRLAELPRLRILPDRPSLMRFRRQPGANCLCTLEAVHAALVGLHPWSPSGPPEALEAMLAVLRHVVDEQVALGGVPAPRGPESGREPRTSLDGLPESPG